MQENLILIKDYVVANEGSQDIIYRIYADHELTMLYAYNSDNRLVGKDENLARLSRKLTKGNVGFYIYFQYAGKEYHGYTDALKFRFKNAYFERALFNSERQAYECYEFEIPTISASYISEKTKLPKCGRSKEVDFDDDEDFD